MASPCREPALCQLYRHTFVPYARKQATIVQLASDLCTEDIKGQYYIRAPTLIKSETKDAMNISSRCMSGLSIISCAHIFTVHTASF